MTEREILKFVVDNKEKIKNLSTEEKSSNDSIQFFKGQILSFNEFKTNTKFEDVNLFEKHLIQDGMTIIGGNDGLVSNGAIAEHNHTYLFPNVDLLIHNRNVNHSTNKNRFINSTINSDFKLMTNDNYNMVFLVNPNDKIRTQRLGLQAQNKAYGIKVLKVVYIAKKDITFKEMVDNGK